MLGKLTSFFNSYQCGWDSFGAGSIASHFRIPASIMDGDGLQTYLSIEELTAKFERNFDSFKAIRYRGSEFLVGCYTHNGENAATVDLGWRILSAVAYEGPYAQATNYAEDFQEFVVSRAFNGVKPELDGIGDQE